MVSEGRLVGAGSSSLKACVDFFDWQSADILLEGLLTVLIALASYWIIEDFPVSAKFLTEEERTYSHCTALGLKYSCMPSSGVFVIRRLQDDMQYSAGGETFNKRYIWKSLTDWKTWIASK